MCANKCLKNSVRSGTKRIKDRFDLYVIFPARVSILLTAVNHHNFLCVGHA